MIRGKVYLNVRYPITCIDDGFVQLTLEAKENFQYFQVNSKGHHQCKANVQDKFYRVRRTLFDQNSQADKIQLRMRRAMSKTDGKADSAPVIIDKNWQRLVFLDKGCHEFTFEIPLDMQGLSTQAMAGMQGATPS